MGTRSQTVKNDGVLTTSLRLVNSKHEARNHKQIKMTEIQNSKHNKISLEHWNLDIKDYFEFRNSNFGFKEAQSADVHLSS